MSGRCRRGEECIARMERSVIRESRCCARAPDYACALSGLRRRGQTLRCRSCEMWREDTEGVRRQTIFRRALREHATEGPSDKPEQCSLPRIHARPGRCLRGKKRNDNEETPLRLRRKNVARAIVTHNAGERAAGPSHAGRFGFRRRGERTLSLRSAESLHGANSRHPWLSWTPHRQTRPCLPGKVAFKATPASSNRRVGRGALALCPPSVRNSNRTWARFALPTLRDCARGDSGVKNSAVVPAKAGTHTA